MHARVLFSAIAAVAFATTALTASADAATYPTNKCVSDKMKAVSANCKTLLKAWSGYDQSGDAAKRDAALASADAKLDAAWAKAEEKSLAKDVDCAVTTISLNTMKGIIGAAVDAIVSEVNTGLTLSNPDHAKCGASLLKAASSKCAAFLKAESGYIAKLSGGSQKRDDAQTKATLKFTSAADAALVGCPSSATTATLEEKIDDLNAAVVSSTTISPNVSDTEFDIISPPYNPPTLYQGVELRPRCSFSTPYHYFVKRGTVNKLVMYYQGGGACWSQITCGFIGTMDKDVIPGTCEGGTNDDETCTDLSDCPDQGGGTSCDPGPDNPNGYDSGLVGSSRVDLQACKLEYSIVSPK